MGWFHSVKNPKLKNVKRTTPHEAPVGLWKKCVECGEILQTAKLEENHQVCPFCQHHYRLSTEARIKLLFDPKSFQEGATQIQTKDPLKFHDKVPYGEKIKQTAQKLGQNDSTRCGVGKIQGQKVAAALMDFHFMGGSMGVVTGEKIALTFERALEEKIPAVVISSTGGARMQEGILSLMQMAKTSSARHQLFKKNIPYISILTDPTTGGCAASFALQGDLNLAEPKALIGFAGPRVIEQAIRQTLPDGFQTSEFLLEHGFIDRIVHRHQMRDEINYFLKFLC